MKMWEFLKAAWRRVFPPPPPPKTHDYTQPIWGHNYNIMSRHGNGHMRLAGWGEGIKKGDYLLMQGQKYPFLRYRVLKIDYCTDPDDMWFADVEWATTDEMMQEAECASPKKWVERSTPS